MAQGLSRKNGAPRQPRRNRGESGELRTPLAKRLLTVRRPREDAATHPSARSALNAPLSAGISAAPPGDDAHARAAAWPVLLLAGLAQWLLWSLAFALTYRAPEIDSAEQFVWSFSLENGYWKHPPVPSWIMHGLVGLFGPSVALPFVATQACIVVALGLTWRLACEFMSPRRALIGVLLSSLVAYHNIGGDCFNHNTALLPFQAATLLFARLAMRRGGGHRWALVGLFAGLSMLVKYVALIPIGAVLLAFVLDPAMRRRAPLAGLALAAGVFALTLLPHLLWLEQTNFLPFRYAQAVAKAAPGLGTTLAGVWDFVVIQAVRCLPLAIGAWWVMARSRAAPRSVPVDRGADTGAFLWVVGLLPLAVTIAVGLFTHTELQSRWGANLFLLSGVLVMAALPRADDERLLQRALRATAVIQLVLCLGLTLGKTVVAEALHVRTRANYPGDVLARHARDTWAAYTDAPLRLVVSDIWLGGNVIANSRQRLAVLIDGRHFKSPWVRDEAVQRCGALVLDDTTDDAAGRGEPNAALDTLMARAEFTGVWELEWAGTLGNQHPAQASGLVRWGIIRPTTPDGCDRP